MNSAAGFHSAAAERTPAARKSLRVFLIQLGLFTFVGVPLLAAAILVSVLCWNWPANQVISTRRSPDSQCSASQVRAFIDLGLKSEYRLSIHTPFKQVEFVIPRTSQADFLLSFADLYWSPDSRYVGILLRNSWDPHYILFIADRTTGNRVLLDDLPFAAKSAYQARWKEKLTWSTQLEE